MPKNSEAIGVSLFLKSVPIPSYEWSRTRARGGYYKVGGQISVLIYQQGCRDISRYSLYIAIRDISRCFCGHIVIQTYMDIRR